MAIITWEMKNQSVNNVLKNLYTLDELKIFFKGYPRAFITPVNTGRAYLYVCWLSSRLSFTIFRNTAEFELYPNEKLLLRKGALYKFFEKGYEETLNLFFSALEEMPLFINDKSIVVKYIAGWRLKIGK